MTETSGVARCLSIVRFVVVLALLAAWSSFARAEQAVDITSVYGAPGTYDDAPHTSVPAYPSLFVVLGADGPRGLPEFSTRAGDRIAIRKVTDLSTYPHSIKRVDLDIADGEILVRLPGDEDPIATYMVDPTFRPKTRSVELRPTGITLEVSSDAVAFRILGPHGNTVQFNDGRVFVDENVQQRVVALYSNGIEEVIYDGIPRAAPDESEPRSFMPEIHLKGMDLSPLPATLLLLLMLGVLGVIAARTD